MTSNTDKTQLNAQADAGQELTENFTSRSADLERILDSLGHAVADSQKKNVETRQDIMARAKNIDASADDASSDAPFEDADIFGALEDQITDVSSTPDVMDDDMDDGDISGELLLENTSGVSDSGNCREEGSVDVSAVETSDVVAKAAVVEGDIDNLADWNQSMADELSRIYSEINGDEPVEVAVAHAFAEQADTDQSSVDQLSVEVSVEGVPVIDQPDIENGDVDQELDADLNPDDELTEDFQADEPSVASSLDEELLDTEYMAVAMQAAEDAPIEDAPIEDAPIEDASIDEVVVEEALDDVIDVQSVREEISGDDVEETQLGITDELADDITDEFAHVSPSVSPSVATEVPVSIDNQLADITSEIENVLDSENDSKALKFIEMRFDHIEEKLNAIIEYPETDAGLFALEAQMNDLKEQFQQVEAQLSGIAGIEENVNALIDEVKSSNGELKTVVAGIAGAAVGGLSTDDAGKNERLAELGNILENYIKERRDTDRYAAGAFSDIQTGLDEIADYLIANDPESGGHVLSEQSHVEQAFGAPKPSMEMAADAGSDGATAIAEDVEAIEVHSIDDTVSSRIEDEPAAQPVVSAHGAAQEAFGLEVDAREDVASHIDDEEIGLDTRSEDNFDETAAEIEIDVTAELDAESLADASLEEFDIGEDAELMEEADLLEAAPHVEEVAEAAHVPEQVVEDVPASPQVQMTVEANSHKVDARMAEEAARREVAQIPVKANETERAGNFLASARKAAIVAAAQAEAERADEALKQGKKKRSLFSFKLGGASPVLVVATTILTATTAGLVYSQIKDGSLLNQIAHSSPSAPRQSAPVDVIKHIVSNKVDKPSNIGNGNAILESRSIIDEVPHHRSADTAGVDVPVGIIVEEPRSKPGLKQLAAAKRRQLLAKMSSDLTGGTPAIAVTNIAFAPESNLGAQTPSVAKNTGPTLALPPASIGPFSLRVAAAKGDAGSQFDVATRYAQGRGVKRDFKLAAKWYGRAAAQGHAIAQYRLAALYEKGNGISRDSSRARTWYRRSAEKGNVKAMHNFAVLHTGRGGKAADYTTAAQWFKSAAEHGLPDSQYNLAILYANGLGVKRSKVEAYKWFALASARGDREAGKRQVALQGLMSGSEVTAAKKLVAMWRDKPSSKSANVPHQAAMLLKKSNVTVDQQKLRLVMRAQNMLGKLGYSVGVADGKMGPKTRDAIRNFQRRSGLKITGDVSQTLITRLSGLTG